MATRRDLIALAALKKARIAAAAARRTAEKARPGRDGDHGAPGAPGLPGRPGLPGKDAKGQDGTGIADIQVESTEAGLRFRITLDDGRELDREVDLPEPPEEKQPARKGGAPVAGFTVRTAMGPAGKSVTAAAFRPEDGHLLLTMSDNSVIDAGAVPVPFDDYGSVEYLADQTSAGSVLTFSFAGGAVQKVWVVMQASDPDDASTGRVRVDGIDPTSTVGTVIQAGQQQPITSPPTTTLKALVPAGKVVSVYGYRR